PDRTALVRAVEELYRSDIARELEAERGLSSRQIDPLRISQTIADAVAYFEAHDPERLDRLWRDVEHYRAMLADYHVRDEAVRARLQHAPPRRMVRSWQAGAGLPVFLYGAAVNALPYVLPRWLAHRTATKETNYATTRLLASVVAVPLFWGLETWLVARWAGAWWAVLFAASLPLSGLLAYRYLGGVGRLRSQIRFGVVALTRHQAASRLLAARQAIVGQLDDAKRAYLGATRGSSF
ncbi:MAG TPA: hypothetical protein VLU43_10180, partial [Anaeromyxobacteraceae bacterium]|nr:hypothetical protein [Anaeromyxobacteraceae bacterium]